MKYRTLGQGLTVSALGIGCMPMVRGGNINYGARRSARVDRHHPPRDRARHHFLRHRRDLRAVPTRSCSAGRSAAAATAWSSPPSSASASSATRSTGIDGSPENARRACDGSLQRLGIDAIDLFYQHRVDPERADRGDGRRHGRPGQRGQGPPHRPVRGRPGDAAPRRTPCIRSPRCSPNIRCGSATSRATSCRSAASSASASCPTARSGAASSPARSRAAPTFPPTTGATTIRAIRRRISPRIWRSSTSIRARRRAPRRQPAQVALAWLLAQGDDIVPIPGASGARRSRTAPPRSISS